MGPASGLGSGSVPPSGRSRPQFSLQNQLQSPRQSLRSLRGLGGTRHGWDPGPLRQCHSGDPGGLGPPSGPVLPDRVSPHLKPTPSTVVEATSLPQLSPTSRIRRPLFVGHPIQGNVGLHSRDFHGESYYDVPALMADPRFRDSMRLIEHYSLLPFMWPRQFYYPRVVLQFYH